MPKTKVLHNRGAVVVVEAHAEVLAMPTGPIGRWSKLFIERLERNTTSFAPVNKRWRWAHYGKPLKQTISSDIDYVPSRTRVYGAVGSSAPHAVYVDQGTGVHGGNGPYPAKILPPWRPGSPSLYEARWVPPGGRRSVRQVMIDGQKGRFYFQKGIDKTMLQMLRRSYQVAGDARISEATRGLPSRLLGVMGNTPASPGFVAELKNWRRWRDERWNSDGTLGHGISPNHRRDRRPKRVIAAEKRQRNENLRKYNESKRLADERAANDAAKAAAQRKRKQEADQRRKEAEEKKRKAQLIANANTRAKVDSKAYYDKIKAAYPDAQLKFLSRPDGSTLYFVTYTGPDGKQRIEAWGYGADKLKR